MRARVLAKVVVSGLLLVACAPAEPRIVDIKAHEVTNEQGEVVGLEYEGRKRGGATAGEVVGGVALGVALLPVCIVLEPFCDP